MHTENLFPPLNEYLARKRDTKKFPKGQRLGLHIPSSYKGLWKEKPSDFQGTSWEHWKRNKTADKLKLFCKESLNTDRNLMTSFLWCQITDLGVTFKVLQQEKQEARQSLSHCWSVERLDQGWLITPPQWIEQQVFEGLSTNEWWLCFVTRGIITTFWVTTRFQVCLRCQDTSCAIRFTPKCLILQTWVSVRQQPTQVLSPDSLLEQVYLVGNSCCAVKPLIFFHFHFSVWCSSISQTKHILSS